MKTIDYVSEILTCCRKREEILINEQSMNKYNRQFDKMRKLAKSLIDENKQDELLPFLQSDSISVRNDIAGILFHFYPELCSQIFRETANMTIGTGLSKQLVIIAATAECNLKYGIPKDYP